MAVESPIWLLRAQEDYEFVYSLLSSEEKEALGELDKRYDEELAKRGGEIPAEEEGNVLENLLDLIPGAREAFDHRSSLEDQLWVKRAISVDFVN